MIGPERQIPPPPDEPRLRDLGCLVCGVALLAVIVGACARLAYEIVKQHVQGG